MHSNADSNTQSNNSNTYINYKVYITDSLQKHKPILESFDLRDIWVNKNPGSVNHILDGYLVCHKPLNIMISIPCRH
jgi:hypothetical protein